MGLETVWNREFVAARRFWHGFQPCWFAGMNIQLAGTNVI